MILVNFLDIFVVFVGFICVFGVIFAISKNIAFSRGYTIGYKNGMNIGNGLGMSITLTQLELQDFISISNEGVITINEERFNRPDDK